MPIFPASDPHPTDEGLAPETESDLEDIVRQALANATALRVVGHGSKIRMGNEITAERAVSLRKLAGIVDYAPHELVMTVRAGTSLLEIGEALRAHQQHLAFEPPFFDRAVAGQSSPGTIGGLLATNLSGPRRFFAGAARDHFLGLRAISGRSEWFKSGGRVVKNVTGYDMCKLLAGAWGTLGLLTEVTVKVLPEPEDETTLAIAGLDEQSAVELLVSAAQRRDPVTGAVHLPIDFARRSRVRAVRGAHAPITVLRLEGTNAAMRARTQALQSAVYGYADMQVLAKETSQALWAEIRDMDLADGPMQPVLWRISVPATRAVETLGALRAAMPGSDGYFDWAGGLIVFAVPAATMNERRVFAAADAAGGHATLARRPDDVAKILGHQPLTPPVAALNERIRKNFDPRGILNPGRLKPSESV